ncbi:hypothetical protein GCM10025759_00660 [Lysobacter panacisoli]|uniref:Uncharacterized protein n=1 Tax=Lysobacter panacisoli TaxID=1255263 RepID=A0ABP9KZD5_9GAMM
MLLGARPPTSPVICTPSLIGTTLSLPLTRLADAAARFTLAAFAVETGAGPAADDEDFVEGVELQADRATTDAASRAVVSEVFINVSIR